MTLTKGYSKDSGLPHKLSPAGLPEGSWGEEAQGRLEHGVARPEPRSEIPHTSRHSLSPSPIPVPSALPQGTAPTSRIPEIRERDGSAHLPPAPLGPVGRERTGLREGGAALRTAPGPSPACGAPGSTWAARTNGKTEGKGRRRREVRPEDWEAGRRRKGETRVPQQSLDGGCPLHPAWDWTRREGVARTSIANELPGASPSRWGDRPEMHRPRNSTEGVTQSP